MIVEIRKFCKELLTGRKVGAILGIKRENSHFSPYLFVKPEEIDDLVISDKHNLLYTCRPSKQNIISIIQQKYPDLKLGIIAKGCDERALFELVKRGQIRIENIEIIGISCDQKQAEECRCPRPYPTNLKFGEKTEGISGEKELEKLMKMSLEERRAFWQEQFSKCIKCYGCRNTCPMCFCKECWMELDWYTKTGRLPPEFPLFHFVQFFHHADTCIECGECENACPMDIPLRLIKKMLREKVRELFNYEAGTDMKQESPLITISDQTTIKE